MIKGTTYANGNSNFFSDNYLELIGEKNERGTFDTKELEVYKVIY